MAVPRTTGYLGINRNDVTYLTDGTIVPPVVGFQGYNPSMSPQLHMAIALVNTGSGTGISRPTVGLGAATNPVEGELWGVDPDGVAVVRKHGYVYVPFNTTTPPAVNGYVVCDGTGKVQAAAAGTVTRARCVGFDSDPHTLVPGQTPALVALIDLG